MNKAHAESIVAAHKADLAMAALAGEPPDLRWPEVERDYALESAIRDLAWQVWDEMRTEAESRGWRSWQ